MGEAPERRGLVWLAALGASVVMLGGVIVALGWMVPAFTSQGQVAGVDPQQLRSACHVAGRAEQSRCAQLERLEALVRAGDCAQARNVGLALWAEAGASPLAATMAEFGESVLASRCPSSPPPAPAGAR